MSADTITRKSPDRELVKPSPDRSIQPRPGRIGGDVILPRPKHQQPTGKPGRLDD